MADPLEPEEGVRRALPGELDAATLHALLRLRVDVFVVEQECPYPEVDGRDLEPGTEHLWHVGDGVVREGEQVAVAATLRVLEEPAGSSSPRRIGRVATAPGARGQGLASVLMTDVVARHGAEGLVLDAQAHLSGWYARHGFEVAGEEFLEDGIPHVPMHRPGTAG
ncbi:GNAT family N-acetyltransferase [uncultured Pseudokineococcus sp.]|uniref:GNAT family N-acetyltransferase n=1 Tax=uncultured Pseudokineococcus sp. TaxID=1642928 RepID=UPI002629A803|nr:GNAT family N-acetyltransferase [uncultured Pseudokineococcus sp.]